MSEPSSIVASQHSAGRPAGPHIVLTGFMGSGKSSVGRALSRLLRWPFADLDDVVAATDGRSVPDILLHHGEPHFRAAELRELARLLARSPRHVLALGGGAPETPALRDLLRRTVHDVPGTLVIHLHAPAAVLHARCQAQLDRAATAAHRPLLGTAEEAAARWTRRLPFYTAISTHQVSVVEARPAETARRIAALLSPAL